MQPAAAVFVSRMRMCDADTASPHPMNIWIKLSAQHVAATPCVMQHDWRWHAPAVSQQLHAGLNAGQVGQQHKVLRP